MYKRILVAYTASTYSTIAMREGVDIARLGHAELHVLAIISSAASFATIDVQGSTHHRIEQELNDVSNELRGQGVNVQTIIQFGDPTQATISTVYSINADLIIIRHSKKGNFARWLQGSIGSNLLMDLPVSLLIASP